MLSEQDVRMPFSLQASLFILIAEKEKAIRITKSSSVNDIAKWEGKKGREKKKKTMGT